jgi:4-hydroxybenzoate polyprenyltransferase
MSSAELAAPAPAWRAWLQLARISNTPTVASNAVAGAVLASTAAEVGTVVPVAIAMAVFYTAGMVLNDVLDEQIDRAERPERPIPSGVVSRQAAIAAVAALFVIGEALLLVAGLEPFMAGLGLVALIVLYDAWHKGNALSPVLMGGCRALVYVVAALAVAESVALEVWTAAAVLLLYIVGLTQVAKAEGGGLLAAWPLAAVLAAIGYWVGWVTSVWFVLLLVAFAAWVVRALWLVRVPRRIGAGVVSLIAGVSLFDALAVASVDGSVAAVAVCLAAFLATIALQTKIAGT